MSTLEDFENAPVGATATSPDGQRIYRRETETPVGADWVRGEGDGRLWADADGLAHYGYTLGPAPAPSTIEDFENAPVGATANGGTWVKFRPTNNMQREWIEVDKFKTLATLESRSNENFAAMGFTLDPLPGSPPDWLDAPAVLAAVKGTITIGDRRQVLARLPDGRWAGRDGNWEAWELTDVTPLYPKGQEA